MISPWHFFAQLEPVFSRENDCGANLDPAEETCVEFVIARGNGAKND